MIWVTCSQPVVCRAKKKKKGRGDEPARQQHTPAGRFQILFGAGKQSETSQSVLQSHASAFSLSRPSAQQDRSSMSSHEEAREYTVIETVRKCFLTRKKIKRGACRNTESWKFSPQAPRTAGSALIEKSGRSCFGFVCRYIQHICAHLV